MRKGKGILKRSAAAVLSAAMVFSMNFSVLPVVAHAQGSQDPGGTGARQNEFQEVKIGLDEIASMAAKTLGPSGDGDTLEASFDGDTATYTNSNYTDPSNSKPQVYTFTFEEQVNLCKVRIHPRNAGGGVGNGAPNSCLVEVSTDGSGYTQAAEQAVTDTSLTWTDISFTAVPAKSVRLTLNSAHETVVSTGEVELYKLTENPDQPDPADKTELKEAIDRVAEKMAGLNEEDYVISSWDALETALGNAQTVYENEGASADDVAAALSALETAEKNLAELISPIYMIDFVSCENGRVTVELNGPTNYVPDGETKWTYEYRDGRHLLYTDNWDTAALAPGETKNYRSVCIYDMNGTDGEGTWSFVYLSDDGAGSVSTEYGNRPAATITAGGKTYDLGNDEDKAEIAGLKFTAAPVVHVSGVDLRGAESQRTGVGESSIDAGAVVSPDRTEMEFPIKSQTGKPASGNYSLYISWHGTTAYFWNIQINSVNVIDRSALEEAIAEAEALTADDYTEQSWAAMQEKLEAAREVLDDVIATTSEVSAASQELNDAVAALEDKTSSADKTELKEAIDRITEKMAELNEDDYIIDSWEALETALNNANTVYENDSATAEDVAAALTALEQAEENLTELISPIYMTDFVSYENGRVTVELNGPTNYVPDGSTEWIYEYRDGKHLLYTDDWEGARLAAGETENYRRVCIYDMNGKEGEGTWSFVYAEEDGYGAVATEYGITKPIATVTAGGRTYDISDSEDLAAIGNLQFTAAPVIHVEGVDLRGAQTRRTNPSEDTIDAEVILSKLRTSMDVTVLSQNGKPASGNYNLIVSWNGAQALYLTIPFKNVNVIDRSALEEAIAEAEALTADDYTEQSWAAMQEKLEAAREVLDDVIATTSEVSAASQELNDAVAALVDKVPPADKTELQQLYNEVKDAVFAYPNTTFCDRFTDALADAADVLENDTAIQEDVDSAYYYLEKYYWLNMVNDKVSYYNPDKAGQDGRFVYSDKITESILPLVSAFKAARYANVNTEPDILKGYYEGFAEAEKHGAETADPDLRGVEFGFNAEDDFDTKTALDPGNYGHFEITGQEFVSDAAGNVSVKVFIRFVNDGISPVTGEEGDDYSVSEMTKASCRVAYESPSQKGSKGISGKDNLNGSYGNGFIGEVTVPLDSVISLTVEDSVMPGFFRVQKFTAADKTELETAINAAEALDEENYTEDSWAAMQEKLEAARIVRDNVLAVQSEVDDAADALNNAREALVPDTDKAALQKLYDEVKDAQFDYPAQSYYKGFTNALNRAGTVLEDEKAFQSEVDTAYNTLEKYYWLNMLNDKVAYYNPDKEGEDGRFIYSDKLTESILPVVAAFQEGSNVSSGASTEKILTCYNAFIDAEKLIQTAENDLRGTEVGFNADAMDPDNYGHFEITGQEFVVGEDGVVRVKVSFKFVNDGIDPISGEQGKPFSLSDMGDLSCRVAYESPSETGSKGVDYQGPLDGNIKNGIEGYFTVDQDSAVNLYFYRTAYMPGYYKVQKFEEADKTALEAAVSEAEALNKEDYLTDSWEVMEEKLEAAKAVLDNPLATDAEVADAAQALRDAIDALVKRADKTELEAAINAAEDLREEDYTEESWMEMQEKLETAKEVMENPEATQTQADDAAKALNDAVDALTVDKTALEEAMKTAEEAIGKEYIYQHDHTWNDFLAAYEHAEDVYENPDAEGEDVKKAAEDLISGYNELVFESEAPAAWFVIGNTQTAIEENALLNEAFDLKFTDNGRLLQFVLNGTEFRIDGTEDGAAFEEIQDVLNEGNGADGKNILIVRDCVPPAGGVYPTESTYTFYFDQTAPAAEVTYSTEEPTDGDVVVTIISNEPLDGTNLPEGWVLSDDGLTAVKTYQENTEETVAFTDGAGNVVTAEIRITNIDRTPQEPENPEDPESPEDPDSPKDPGQQNDPGKKPGQSDGTRTDGKSNSAKEERPSAVRTGDNTNPGVCVSVMAVSAAAAAGIIRKKKEEKH